jgi:hypothetical protein
MFDYGDGFVLIGGPVKWLYPSIKPCDEAAILFTKAAAGQTGLKKPESAQ